MPSQLCVDLDQGQTAPGTLRQAVTVFQTHLIEHLMRQQSLMGHVPSEQWHLWHLPAAALQHVE